MSQFLVFSIGLLIGLFGGMVISSQFTMSKKHDFENEYNAFTAIFDQYVDELSQKQAAIQQDLKQLETKIPDLARQPRTQQVLDLINLGYSTAQVAKKLEMGIGEVELICQLVNCEISH